MKNNIFSAIIGGAFLAILIFGFIANLIIPDKTFSAEENRILQQSPKFSISHYIDGRYENKVEKYHNDQFLFRNTFIHVKSAADTAMGKVEANGVYLGKDGYLLEDISTPSGDWMSSTTESIIKFKQKYPSIKMNFMLVPNAANILSDKLPDSVVLADQNKYIDKFNSRIKNDGIKIIDVRKTFKNKKDKVQLYYRTDHHWTSDGAYIAFKKAAKILDLDISNESFTPYVVKRDFRGTLSSKSGFRNGLDDYITIYLPSRDDYLPSIIHYSDTKKKTTEFFEMDNLDTKDAYTVFGGSNHPLYTIQTPTVSQEKLLIVKDSYANSFIPFISQYYRKVVVVDPRYFFDEINTIIKSEEITQVLFLYNANTFFKDNSLEMMLS